jgi:hypothetical protein
MLVKNLRIGCFQIFLLVILHEVRLHLGSIQYGEKNTEDTINNMWKSVDRLVRGKCGDPSLEHANNTEYVLVEVHYQEPTAHNDDDDDTIDN